MERPMLEFHHTGILVSNSENYLKNMPRAYLFEVETFDDPVQSALLTLVKLPGYFLELIEPEAGSVLYEELGKKENQVHHICFIVRDEVTYEFYRKRSIKIAGPYHSIMFNAQIEFYRRADGLIEEIVKYF